MQAAAEAAEDYIDGVWFVGLAALTDVYPSWLRSRRRSACRGERQDVSRRARRLPARAAALLVLDNLEELLRGGGGGRGVCGRVCRRDFLATSREPLRIGAERQYSVRARSGRGGDPVRRAGRPRARRGPSQRRGDLRAARRAAAGDRAGRGARQRSPPAMLLERLEQRLPLLTGVRVTPPNASEPCARRSPGATTCLTSPSSNCSRASPCSQGAARSRRPRPSATLKSTRSARCWTRTCSAAGVALRDAGDDPRVRARAARRGRRRRRVRRRHAEHFLASRSRRNRARAARPAPLPRPARGRPRQLPCRALVATRPRSRERAEPRSRARRVLAHPPPRSRRTRLARGGARRRVAGAERHACRSTRLGGVSLERARRRRSRALGRRGCLRPRG